MANWFMRITSIIDPASDSVLTTTANPEPEPLINRMLLHVHENIHSSDKLRISYLASHFNLSANYVGEYFRKLTGESLQHYITQYKIQLVQHRLANSPLTVAQIADELGFSDESHLSRQFRSIPVALAPSNTGRMQSGPNTLP